MSEYTEERNEKGFTLIELLVAIVVVGVLTAVAIVGIAGLTDKGEQSACNATRDAVNAAQAVHYANNDGSYPFTFQDLVDDKELELQGSANIDGAGDIVGTGWTLSETGGGTTPMIITACPSGTTPTT
jgi:prepilin-type N-terminal cleavage/methylation domain-containing protein